MILGVDVGDIMDASSDAECDSLVRSLVTSLPTNNLGDLTYKTGCVFGPDWVKGTLSVSQTACIDQPLDHFDITTTNPVPSSSSVGLRVR